MPETPEFSLDQLTGRSRTHVSEILTLRCTLHNEVVAPFLAMRAAAAADGIDLTAVSSFRDFDRQLAIWNGKFRGERPVLGRSGEPMNSQALTREMRVMAILWWSALPGASRHHWGTDFDVVDARATPDGYKLQMVPEEYGPSGPFHLLTTWLDTHMHAFGFFRPYAIDRGGVSPEPWHLSYAPVARHAQSAFSPAKLHAVLADSAIEGREEVLEALDLIYATYVTNVDVAPEAALLSPRLA